MLSERYTSAMPKFQKERTYLFEIIYPENKIVVDYGDTEGLFLLAIIDNQTGKDLPLEDIGFPTVRRFDGVLDFKELKKRNLPNAEGFVLKFQSGFRVKVKFEEYVRLHRLITQFSNVSIWENLMNGMLFDELLERVPDEFYQWVRSTKENLERQYAEIESECKSVFRTFDSRKETAQYFLTQKHPSILFAMLDGKDYSKTIWKLLRPVFSKPFHADTKI
jgi:RNA ligase